MRKRQRKDKMGSQEKKLRRKETKRGPSRALIGSSRAIMSIV